MEQAREYLRVSHDSSGRARSTDEQHADNEKAAEQHGFVLGEPYRDVDRSASRYARKAREAFDRLTADLRADRFGADVLVLWESSRGSRKVGEWVELIDLLEEYAVHVFVTTHGRRYDPANPRDRRTLLEDAVDSEYESAKSSSRLRRTRAADAAAGRPHGRVPYGYRRIYDPATRRLVAQEIHPDEATVVAELFERLEAGHALHAIATDFAKRGVVNRSGRPFTREELRPMALRWCYAGKRTHIPSRNPKVRAAAKPTPVEATWPEIVPMRRFLAVRRILTSPERKTTRPGRAKHLLSLIAACAVCGGPLTALSPGGIRYYRCQRSGHVRLGEAELDAHVVEYVILEYLGRRAVFETFAHNEDQDEHLRIVREQLAKARAELDELKVEVTAGRLRPAFAGQVAPGIEERITALEARERELMTPPVLQGLLAPGEDVALRWHAAPMPVRREVARLLLSPDWLGELRVLPAPRRGAPVADRVTLWQHPGDAA